MSLWTTQKKIKAWTSIFPPANNNPSFKTGDRSSKTGPYPCVSSHPPPVCTPWPPPPRPPAATSSAGIPAHPGKLVGCHTAKFGPAPLLFHQGTIPNVHSFQSRRDATKNHSCGVPRGGGGRVWRVMLSMVSNLRANNPVNEKFGGWGLKPID